MKQHNLEIQFKEKLNSREIKPTETAWDKLDSMLSVVEKPKRNFKWMYVAASFGGFLLISTLYFTNKENAIEIPRKEVVIQQSIQVKNNKKSLNTLNLNAENSKHKYAVIQKAVPINNKKSVVSKDSLTDKNNQNQIAELSIINQKKEQESILSQTNAATVDQLLARVNQSARLNGNSNPNLAVRVNASQLLEQVDNDLEPTFRQSVFSKVADNFKAVKEAVVNRNRE
jgi:hypothetical protein